MRPNDSLSSGPELRSPRTDSLHALLTFLDRDTIDAEVVVWVSAAPRCRVACAAQRVAGRWRRLPLPPVSLGVAPQRMETQDLERSSGALEDALRPLGQRWALVVPLQPERYGSLVMTRPDPPFDEPEAEALVARVLARRNGLRPVFDPEINGSEFETLFDLIRELNGAESVASAFDLVRQTLERQLHPEALALCVALREADELQEFAVPNGPHGLEAAWRARGERDPTSDLGPDRSQGSARPAGLTWVSHPLPLPHGRLVLGFRGTVPSACGRVTPAVGSALALSLGRLRAQRQAEEGRLAAIVDGLPLGAVLLTAEGRVRFANPGALELLARERVQLVTGQRLDRLGGVELREAIARAARGEGARWDLMLAEEQRTLELQLVPGSERTGGDVLLVVEDVTLSRRRQQDLARYDGLSLIGTLLAGLVHDLSSPLGTVIGYIEMLRELPQATDRDRWLALAHDELDRAKGLVADINQVTPRPAGPRQLISPVAVAEKALSLMAYQFRLARVTATLGIDPETPAFLGDYDAILRVLINLLTNAVHALEARDEQRLIHVTTGVSGQAGAVVRIVDNGPGIATEIQGRIFNPFFTTKSGKGTGLGLSQAVETMRQHGGTIAVESVPGNGAAFILEFPRCSGATESS